MTDPSQWRVLRVHTRPLTHRVVYEQYAPSEHAIYYTYITKSNVIGGFRLDPDTRISDYLHQTDGEYM